MQSIQVRRSWAQVVVGFAVLLAVGVGAAASSSRRNLLQTIEERVLDPFERIRTCAPVNILVRAEPDPEAIPVRKLPSRTGTFVRLTKFSVLVYFKH
jgi:hypothetical protein